MRRLQLRQDSDGGESSPAFPAMDLGTDGLMSVEYIFRCTVEVERNGTIFEYLTEPVTINVSYDDMGGECSCGCGMPGCMCDPACPTCGGVGPDNPDDPMP